MIRGAQLKVFWSVVCPNAIDVMNGLSRQESSAKDVFHHKAVFEVSATITHYAPVAITGQSMDVVGGRITLCPISTRAGG